MKCPAIANRTPFTVRSRDRDKSVLMLLGSRFALRSTNCHALRAHSRNLANLASVRGPLDLPSSNIDR